MHEVVNKPIAWIDSTYSAYMQGATVKPVDIQEKTVEPNGNCVPEEAPKVYFCNRCGEYFIKTAVEHSCQGKSCKERIINT